MTWRPGDVIVRREIHWGEAWAAMALFVVEDSAELLATYVADGAPLTYRTIERPEGPQIHAWVPRSAWAGSGTLMLHRPGDAYSVWIFWAGEERRFESWYINFEEPFRRTSIGFDTHDHELDIVLLEDGQWFFKDEEKLAGRIAVGQDTAAVIAEVRRLGGEVGAMIDSKQHWWSDHWTRWQPDPSWDVDTMVIPSNWAEVAPITVLR